MLIEEVSQEHFLTLLVWWGGVRSWGVKERWEQEIGSPCLLWVTQIDSFLPRVQRLSWLSPALLSAFTFVSFQEGSKGWEAPPPKSYFFLKSKNPRVFGRIYIHGLLSEAWTKWDSWWWQNWDYLVSLSNAGHYRVERHQGWHQAQTCSHTGLTGSHV